jgi:hypothetical protein
MGRKSKLKQQKIKQQENQIPAIKAFMHEWQHKPQMLWPSQPEKTQIELWNVMLQLCCKAQKNQKEKGEGYFCVHFQANSDTFTYHWEALSKNPELAANFKEIEKDNSSDLNHFWICINDEEGIIPNQCFQMRFFCELASYGCLE